MQNTSKLYRDIMAGDHWFETRLCIGDTGSLIDHEGNRITFGKLISRTRIRAVTSDPDSGYDDRMLVSVTTTHPLFSGTPSVGNTCSGEIDVQMLKPAGAIPKRAKLSLFVRATDGTRYSEWIPKGVYFVDSRSETPFGDDTILELHGYDAILKAEADYPELSSLTWPAKDIDVLGEIAGKLGISLDSRVSSIVKKGYEIQYPTGYSCREVLGFIGAMYAGNWSITDSGALMLIPLFGLPNEGGVLVVSASDRRAITFGGDRILV